MVYLSIDIMHRQVQKIVFSLSGHWVGKIYVWGGRKCVVSGEHYYVIRLCIKGSSEWFYLVVETKAKVWIQTCIIRKEETFLRGYRNNIGIPVHDAAVFWGDESQGGQVRAAGECWWLGGDGGTQVIASCVQKISRTRGPHASGYLSLEKRCFCLCTLKYSVVMTI